MPSSSLRPFVEPRPPRAERHAAAQLSQGWASWARPIGLTASVTGLYLLIGVVAFWPVVPGATGRLSGATPDIDQGQTVWFIGWAAHAVAHFQNLFFSNAVFAPHGANLAQSASVPLLGVLGAPLTWAFGPVATTNLFVVLAMPLSSFAAFAVLRKWGVWGPAAAIGGLIYGFSPYMVGHAMFGHLDLVFLPLPPFIAMTVSSIVHRQGSPRRLGIRLGILSAAQFFISQEVLAGVALLTAFALIYAAIYQPGNWWGMAKKLIIPASVALVVAGALVAYPLWLMVAGPQHYVGAAYGTRNPYHNDLLSFLVPGPLQRTSLGMRALGISLIGRSDVAESSGYIGIPVLLLASAMAWRSRRSRRTQVAVLVFAVAGILSLGPHLLVDGHFTNIPLPSLLLTKLPLLTSALPARFSFEVDACLAAILAFGLDDLRRAWLIDGTGAQGAQRQTRITVMAVGLLIAVTQLPLWPYPSQPAPVLPAGVRQVIPPGDPVAITFPYVGPRVADALDWQAEDFFGFRLLGGYAAHPGPSGHMSAWPDLMMPAGLQQFLSAASPPALYGPAPALGPRLVAFTRQLLADQDVRLVLVERSEVNSAEVVDLFTRALGRPKALVGGFVVWAGWSPSPNVTPGIAPSRWANSKGLHRFGPQSGPAGLPQRRDTRSKEARPTTFSGQT